MTQYIVSQNLVSAEAQSANFWKKIIGRDPNVGDVTTMLSQCEENPIDKKGVIIVEDSDYARLYPLLTPAEQAWADENLLPASDPYIVEFLAALEQSRPGRRVANLL